MSIPPSDGRAVEAGRAQKSAAHLLLLPVAFGVMGACCYGLVVAACRLAAVLREDTHGFAGYGEYTKLFIVLPLLLASIPVGFLAVNLFVWLIPPLRGFFDREARGRPDGDFPASMRGLLAFSKYWIPPWVAIGFGAAFFGK